MVKTHRKGEACLIRYADDFVCAFQYEQDAQSFFKALEFRLKKFGLQLAVDKLLELHEALEQMKGNVVKKVMRDLTIWPLNSR